ncbi:MAG: M48 family peptidase, partial [Burkholderiales bacterium]|nr:M48 family peptidase [Burkholderiales bacterium]
MSHHALLALCLAALLAGCASTTTGSVAEGGQGRSQLLLVSSEEVMKQSLAYYEQQNREARAKGELIISGSEWRRVNTIMQRLVPQVAAFRPDAARWPWQLV